MRPFIHFLAFAVAFINLAAFPSQALGDLVYVAEFFDSPVGTIKRLNTVTEQVETLVTGLDNVYGLAVSSSKIYWSEYFSTGDKIRSADLDGSNIEDVIVVGGDDTIRSIAVDTSAGKLYWGERKEDALYRSDLNGSNIETVVSDATNYRGLAIDPLAEKLYWGQQTSLMIARANADGTGGRQNLLAIDNGGIAIDPGASLMYLDSAEGVRRANLDGSDLTDPLFSRRGADIEVDLFQGKLYGVDGDDTLWRANTDGTGFEILLGGLSNTKALAFSSSVPEPSSFCLALLGSGLFACFGRRSR